MTLDGVLAMLKEVTPELSCPVVLFSYFKPVMKRGMADFAAAVREAGAHGLLVPDLPQVATAALRSEAIKNNLELVLLTTPTTTEERMREVTEASSGPALSGPRANVNTRVESLIQEVKQVTDKPVAVGFGISTAEHVKQTLKVLSRKLTNSFFPFIPVHDGVIIGSAMVRQLGEAASPEEGLERLEKYARSMKRALP
ncbi:hypothetical protein C2845_PM01G23590 [Panicum miliaceum]|uniref:tryptophan synthase n=1 Tax=Panicum miliaceum TaxID=4540 RepID=A0A3L6TU64_PANMI|nr:hypothetical protein C2845_PM01G23590 [Panicum miliaceum]